MNHRRRERQLEARERQEARADRTHEQQIHVLCNRGHGHCREADRLEAANRKATKAAKENG